MTLTAQAREHLAAVAAAGTVPVDGMTVAQARAAALGYLALQRPPEQVAHVAHRFIPGPTADLPLRVYYPEGTGPFPAVLMFHGSGWVICNLDVSDEPARVLANRSGCAVVAVNYQKAPEHPFPTPLDDCYAALAWVADNAHTLGVDPSRIAVLGDSAGGNLAAAVCLRARDLGGPAVRAQVLLYPVLDHRFDTASYDEHADGYGLSRRSMRWFWDHYLSDPAHGDAPLASPLRAPDVSGLPPAFVVTAEHDPLRDEGERYAERLRDAGVPVVLRRYAGMIHGFLWMDGVLDGAADLQDEVGEQLRRLLRDRTA